MERIKPPREEGLFSKVTAFAVVALIAVAWVYVCFRWTLSLIAWGLRRWHGF